ncbi:conserved hypothetical protein [Arthrobacter sp. 9AX]|uniref:hypothetical protein n=1 Tax=Arthrobacter sp. 9AX TaxID=2653131 RepID=UPI0012F12B7C|nr:hypothetical protein [Arthrobacter sp. 9AX]VXB26899.1 conserved hypothetical protein [Arthrobacter sp. 9AX]
MADSPGTRGAGKDDEPKKHPAVGPGDAGELPQEEPEAAAPEAAPAVPEEAPRRPPGLYGYDPDQWPESH